MQKKRILQAFIRGAKLTTLSCAMRGMGVKLPNRISELEHEGYVFKKDWKKNDKTGSRWIEYSLKSKPKNK